MEDGGRERERRLGEKWSTKFVTNGEGERERERTGCDG